MAGERKSYRIGFANGLLFASGNLMCAVGFIYSGFVIAKELDRTTITVLGTEVNCATFWLPEWGDNPAGSCSFTPANLIIALFACQMGSQAFGLIEPAITAFTKARKAAATIMEITERVPVIEEDKTDLVETDNNLFG